MDLLTSALVNLTAPPKTTSVLHSAADSAYYSAPNTLSNSVSSPRHMPPGTIHLVVLQYTLTLWNLITPLPTITSSCTISQTANSTRSPSRSSLTLWGQKMILSQLCVSPSEPENRPMVPKSSLTITFCTGRISGGTRMVRMLVRKPGQRRCSGPNEEMTWYFGEKVRYD